VKFLGIKISSEKKTTIEQAWNSINRHLAYIKGKLRYAEPIVREEVMGAYIRQLLIYFATPLVAADLITSEKVDRWEEELYRKLYLLPTDLKRTAIVNTVRRRRPASKVIFELARKVKNQAENQKELGIKKHDLPIRSTNQEKKGKIYVPRVLAEAIWGACRKKLTCHHHDRIFCTKHRREADLAHFNECDLAETRLPIEPHVERIKKISFQEWEARDQLDASLAFGLLQIQI
jgi:hypothetical protein